MASEEPVTLETSAFHRRTSSAIMPPPRLISFLLSPQKPVYPLLTVFSYLCCRRIPPSKRSGNPAALGRPSPTSISHISICERRQSHRPFPETSRHARPARKTKRNKPSDQPSTSFSSRQHTR